MRKQWWVVSLASVWGVACHQGTGAEGVAPSSEACPTAWLEAPAVDSPIALPTGNGRLVLHAAASGSQNYTCSAGAGDGGPGYTWSFAGPEAVLKNCREADIGRHFASDRGPAAPAWQTADGAEVVGHKVGAAPPGAGSIPWLLIAVDSHAGNGPLGDARFVQRVRTQGGLAPASICDASHVGQTQKVPYTADYYFYAP